MATINLQEPVYKGAGGPVFFAAGFRPFFLSAGVAAALLVPLWLLMFLGVLNAELPYPSVAWHGHEMVFGFGAAAVGGFLLTAVPNWTNTHHVSGQPLMVLFGCWLAGRVAMLLGGVLPPLLVAAIDLAYLPLLGVLMAGPLIKAGKWRNIAFLPILGVLFLANLCVHLQAVAGVASAMNGVYLGIFVLLLMITIVGGRIIPSFTQSWLRMQHRPVELHPIGWIEKGGAAGSLVLAGVVHVAAPGSAAAGVAALAAAAIHGVRLSRWHGAKTLANPILWVLHLGYLWMAVGLALLGVSVFVHVLPASAAIHALTAGCIGTMVIAVMSRASLGHAGHPLEVAPATVRAYVLISLGALLRVVAPLSPGAMVLLTGAGGLAWTLGWLMFVAVYWPIVTRPRADGRPG
jgi:uncharacterized protein involved in response to NO